MFRYLATIIILIGLISCKARQKTLKLDEAQQSQNISLDFPYDVLGYWEGQLEIFGVDSLLQTVPMAVLIDETLDPVVFQWELIYNPGDQEDRRPYLLLMHNKERNHYKIDEDNGIILDCFLFENKLISTFDVGGTLLTTMNTFLEDDMVFEVIAGPIEIINTTGDMKVNENIVPPVNSYQTKTYQRAVLKRIRG